MSGSLFHDVRMRGFGPRAALADVLALLAARTRPLDDEVVPTVEGAGRVLSEPVVSTVDIPGFARSAMDGYAIRSLDTANASPTRPIPFAFIGTVGPGQAVQIATGAPVPAGADAILMAEFSRLESESTVLALDSAAVGKHVVRVGEDVARGTTVLPAGRRLRPQDLGLLAAIGVVSVRAVRQPRVAIVVTGNELLPPGSVPTGFNIVDSNSPMLAALAVRDGAIVLSTRYVRDDFASTREALREACRDADLVFVSGGTSVGPDDHAARAAAELGELAIHGVALRPAGPLGVAFLPRNHSAPVPVFLLPGNPVSCLCAFDLCAGQVLRRLGGRKWEVPYRVSTLPLATGIASAFGRIDYVRVAVDGNVVVPLAAGGAANLSRTVAADGFILVPADRAALLAEEVVSVWLYDE
jgi:molybdopterin molybdotransferase